MKAIIVRLVLVLLLIAIFDTYPLGTGYPMDRAVHILAFAVMFIIGDRLISKYLR